MQNTVLRSLGASLAVLDENGLIVEVNDSWTQFAQENGGQPNAIGIGVNYLDVCRRSIPEFPGAQHILKGILSVMNGGAERFRHEYRCDSSSEPRWFVMTAVPHPRIRGGAVISHRDDTQIRRTELRYGELLDAARAILWHAEAPTFKTTFVSKQIEEILGFPVEAWTTDPNLWKNQLHPEDREWALEYTSQEVAAGRKHAFTYRIIDAHGKTIWLRNIVSVVVENGEVRQLLGISVDVTERIQIEQERDQLVARLFQSQDEERSSIARVLHDDICQDLAALTLKLGGLRQSLEPGSKAAELAIEAQAFASTLATDVQRLSHGLHSSILDLLGLELAVSQHCQEYASSSPAEVQVHIEDVPRDLEAHVALCTFRVLQECLRNITKHSKAQHVTVRLSSESDQIKLEVSDDGVGFDPKKETIGQGLGLANMSERIRLVHGKLDVSASNGNGTQVTATVPLRIPR